MFYFAIYSITYLYSVDSRKRHSDAKSKDDSEDDSGDDSGADSGEEVGDFPVSSGTDSEDTKIDIAESISRLPKTLRKQFQEDFEKAVKARPAISRAKFYVAWTKQKKL